MKVARKAGQLLLNSRIEIEARMAAVSSKFA
jgi:hypothetical protein